MSPIRLTDSQLRELTLAARMVPFDLRQAFLELVAAELRGREILGDGVTSNSCHARSRRSSSWGFDQPSSFPEPVSRDRVDVLLVDVPTQELLAKYRGRYRGIPLVVLLDGTDSEHTVHALSAGARAVLDRSASRSEIIAAIKAVAAGLVVVLPDLLAALLRGAPP